MSTKVFLSVGRTFTTAQEEFVSDLESFLQANGLTAQTVGRTFFSSEQPLRAILHVLRECSGAVILAFERVFIKQGCEKRGSPKESPLEETNLPTVWNQIEAAMAYTLGHPLLVIVDESLRTEGLLESGYDWYVLRVPLAKESLAGREFVGVFTDWRQRVLEQERRRPASQPATGAPRAESPAPPPPSGGATRGVTVNLGAASSDASQPAPPDQPSEAPPAKPVAPPNLLDKAILKSFYTVMVDAYADKVALRQCVLFGLGEELDAIAGGQSITETLLNLVAWARRTGRVEELMNAAYQHNPGNPALKSFVLTTLGKLPGA